MNTARETSARLMPKAIVSSGRLATGICQPMPANASAVTKDSAKSSSPSVRLESSRAWRASAQMPPYTSAPDICVSVARHCQPPRLACVAAITPPPSNPKTSVTTVAKRANSARRSCNSALPSAVSRGTEEGRG